MIGAGINDGDMLVVDRGLTNYKDKVVDTSRPVLKPQSQITLTFTSLSMMRSLSGEL